MERNEILSVMMEMIAEVGVADAVEEIKADTALVSCGVLDSFGKVELVDEIWERFRLEISPAELFTGEVTAMSIADVIEEKLRRM